MGVKTVQSEVCLINDFPWGRPEVYPTACANISFIQEGIFVHLYAEEQFIRATVTEDNGPVYKDSCLEFFFCPMPGVSDSYFNFEVNPLGALYVGFSSKGTREDSKPIDYSEFKEIIGVKVNRKENSWDVSYKVPYKLIQRYMPEFAKAEHGCISANFYKCGDETKYPHFAVWNHIDPQVVTKPDFHVVKYFKIIKY